MTTSGVIAINKPKGWTSFDVVNKLKPLFRPKKVGHLGTLDPMATGVLLITYGRATKLFDLAQQKTKTYIAKFEFGYTTDTLDATGKVTDKTTVIPKLSDIKDALNNLTGEIEQLPPKYSAKSVGGIRAYDLARRGKDFELKPKLVRIDKLKILSYLNNILELEIVCGSGTYIRSIGRDLAERLNSRACMISLTRTDVGDINISKCLDLEKIKDSLSLDNIVMFDVPIPKLLNLQVVSFDGGLVSRLLNGQTCQINAPDGKYVLEEDGNYLAIIEVKNFEGKMILYLE